MVSAEIKKSEKKRLMGRQYNVIFCPYCGASVDHNLLGVQGTICIECKKDMDIVLKEAKMKREFNKYCKNCSFANPNNTNFCIKCGSEEFSETKKKYRSKFFHRQNLIIGIVSVLISVGITCGIVFGLAAQFVVLKGIVAAVVIVSFSLIISWFVFVIISNLVRRDR